MAQIWKRVPRFATLQLVLITTLAALLAGLFTTAYQWRPVWILADVQSDVLSFGPYEYSWRQEIYQDVIPIHKRIVPITAFVFSLAAWAGFWGIVRKRVRESLKKERIEKTEGGGQAISTYSSRPVPFGLTMCWGLMMAGGLVALSFPIMEMFVLGPRLFPTIYFSLFVGLAAIARGAARDTVNLKGTAGLQLANMIALDPANVVFAAMEFALLRSRSVREYLGAENR